VNLVESVRSFHMLESRCSCYGGTIQRQGEDTPHMVISTLHFFAVRISSSLYALEVEHFSHGHNCASYLKPYVQCSSAFIH
jgi:hypothetical protein